MKTSFILHSFAQRFCRSFLYAQVSTGRCKSHLTLQVYHVDSSVRRLLRHSVYSDSLSRYAQKDQTPSHEKFPYFCQIFNKTSTPSQCFVTVLDIKFKETRFSASGFVHVLTGLNCHWHQFLRRVRKFARKRLLASSCLSVYPSVPLSIRPSVRMDNSALNGRIFMKFDI